VITDPSQRIGNRISRNTVGTLGKTMGIEAVLETEDGEQLDSVGDPTNVLHRVLPKAGDPSFQCLSCIDWYGDTVFNYLHFRLPGF
jgi:hypothetical protein